VKAEICSYSLLNSFEQVKTGGAASGFIQKLMSEGQEHGSQYQLEKLNVWLSLYIKL
jgi:hypothetical protein